MRIIPLKRTMLAGAASLALVGATLGAVGAQQQPAASPTPTAPAARQAQHDQFLNTVAAKLGVTPDRLRQAMEQTRQELGIRDHQPGGPGGPRGHGGPRLGFEVAARTIGISVDQLRQELAGKSLADVAQAHSVSPTTVANALKADANTRIDQAAAAGRIPADQVAQAKQRAAEQIDQSMTRQGPTGGPGGRPGR